MPNTITITQANYRDPNHACAIRSLMAAYSSDIMGGGKALPKNILSKLPEALANRSDAFSAMAWRAEQAVGLITGFEGFSTFYCESLLNIHDLFVQKQYRRLGIASKLLDYAESIAVNRGYCKMTLEVLEGNAEARAAYKKMHFHGYQLNPTTGHALFLEKPLI